jgi:PAS domain S-box-containing protein
LDIGRLAIQATWLNFISGLFAGCLITLYSFLFYRDTQKSREVESQLRQMDNLNKAILDSSKQLIMTTNAQGVITFFNKEAEKTLGYEASTVVGSMSILDFYAHSTRVGTPEERSRTETFKRSEFDTLVAASKYLIWTDSERVMKRKNGQLLSCSQTITALRDENNEIKGYLFIGSDLTDYKKWEKDLRNAREAIETAQLSQNQFLVSLSHDLKVPLNLTMNFSSLLMKNIGGNLTDQEISYASRIHDNCQSILNLINRMLVASKSEIN